MSGRIYWEIISPDTEAETIQWLEENVNKHGFIIDFKRFSDLGMSVIIELYKGHINELQALFAAKFQFKENGETPGGANADAQIFLHIQFTRGTGQKRVEVPAVPG